MHEHRAFVKEEYGAVAFVASYFNENNSIARNKDMDFLEKHYHKLIEELYLKFESYDEITTETVQFAYKAYHILNGLGQLSMEMENKYKSLFVAKASFKYSKGRKTWNIMEYSFS